MTHHRTRASTRGTPGKLTFALCLLLTALPIGATPSTAPPCDGPRAVALTFDDLPAQRAQRLPQDRIARLTDGILSALAAAQAPAIGFVNEDKLEIDGERSADRVRLLERWLDAGHELGNHSYSHPDLHRVPLADFLADVARGDQVTRRLVAERGTAPRYFRHPFLHTGRDLETRAAVERHLADDGYRVAPVTIDNSEWIFARATDEALDRGDEELGERLDVTYLDYMVAMVRYYEGQSCAIVGRLIPQVLLLHANAINGRTLGELLDRLGALGYRFIELPEALEDAAYSLPDRYTGPAGITWLHRWALTRGVEPAIFAGEPTTPEWVQEIAGVRE